VFGDRDSDFFEPKIKKQNGKEKEITVIKYPYVLDDEK
jgi:hypothetical protein